MDMRPFTPAGPSGYSGIRRHYPVHVKDAAERAGCVNQAASRL
jgi:hypothetical protein